LWIYLQPTAAIPQPGLEPAKDMKMKHLLLCIATAFTPLLAGAQTLAMDLPTGQGSYNCAGVNKNVSIAWSDAGLVKVRYYEEGKFKEETALMIKAVKGGVVKMKAPDYTRQVHYDVKQRQATVKGFAPAEMMCNAAS
jgi:hypothetical protein